MGKSKRVYGAITVNPFTTKVRETGLEPAQDCSRQPLKLVRLPIPPLPRGIALRKLLWVCASFQEEGANLTWKYPGLTGSDFNRGPGAFTNSARNSCSTATQVGSGRRTTVPGGEKNNAPGDAIASNRTRGGTPQRMSRNRLVVSEDRSHHAERDDYSRNHFFGGSTLTTKPGLALNAFTVLPSDTFHTTTPPS